MKEHPTVALNRARRANDLIRYLERPETGRLFDDVTRKAIREWMNAEFHQGIARGKALAKSRQAERLRRR